MLPLLLALTHSIAARRTRAEKSSSDSPDRRVLQESGSERVSPSSSWKREISARTLTAVLGFPGFALQGGAAMTFFTGPKLPSHPLPPISLTPPFSPAQDSPSFSLRFSVL